VHRVEEFKYFEVFEGLPQGVHVEFFWRLELRRKHRRVSAFEVSQVQRSEVSLQVDKSRRRNTSFISQKLLRKERMVRILRGEFAKSRGPLDLAEE
jgi:hypothetical protein